MKLASASRALLVGTALAAAPLAQAQAIEDKWTFQAILYGFFPEVGGSSKFPERTGGSSINVSNSEFLDSLKFAFLGTFEARRGRWGVFTDFIYLDVGGNSSNTRNFTIGGRDIPASVSANLDLDIKGVLWTLAGEYRVVTDPSTAVYVLAGTRLLDVKTTLSYSLSADVPPYVGPGRSGTSEVKEANWDAIIGVKGRLGFGANREWFVPFYADIGTGESDLTYMLFGGLGYQFKWGSVLGGWRYIDYKFKSSSDLERIDFSGPMIGVAFNW